MGAQRRADRSGPLVGVSSPRGTAEPRCIVGRTRRLRGYAMASITPTEEELPWIISVDDHVLEPRELWQRELPASLRDRGPKVVREKIGLGFKGGSLHLERDAEDGHWCDLWLFDDLISPTGLRHAPAGLPRDQHDNRAAIYEDFRI